MRCFDRRSPPDGGQVSQPIFTGGTLKGNLHLAESEAQALIAHRQAIQRAFGDFSDALIGYGKLDQVRTAGYGRGSAGKSSHFHASLKVARPQILKCWTHNGHFTAPNSRWPRRGATNTEASAGSIKRSAEAGSSSVASVTWRCLIEGRALTLLLTHNGDT